MLKLLYAILWGTFITVIVWGGTRLLFWACVMPLDWGSLFALLLGTYIHRVWVEETRKEATATQRRTWAQQGSPQPQSYEEMF